MHFVSDYCTILPDPTSGSVVFSTTANANSNYPSGTTATYTCTSGLGLVGVTSRMCMDGDASGAGTWSDSEPACERMAIII